jgi:predicted nucleic acid-binding protein
MHAWQRFFFMYFVASVCELTNLEITDNEKQVVISQKQYKTEQQDKQDKIVRNRRNNIDTIITSSQILPDANYNKKYKNSASALSTFQSTYKQTSKSSIQYLHNTNNNISKGIVSYFFSFFFKIKIGADKLCFIFVLVV